jgi:hypothetical protein
VKRKDLCVYELSAKEVDQALEKWLIDSLPNETITAMQTLFTVEEFPSYGPANPFKIDKPCHGATVRVWIRR